MDPHLQSARTAIDEAAGDLSVDVLARKTGDRWSIAEILEHLILAFTASAAALEKPLASGEPRTRTPSLKQTLGRIIVVDVGYFPRVNAPQMTLPSGTIPVDRAVPAIREALEALDSTLTRVAQRFGEKVAVSNHPYLAGMTVAQWRKFHWRHTVHHMAQVRERARM